jgi:serine/threonine protein kinase
LIRPFGNFTAEDIDNEVDAVSQLCRPGGNQYVVQVHRHGFLPQNESQYYYIDMEYCSESLDDRIHRVAFKDEQIKFFTALIRNIETSSTTAEKSPTLGLEGNMMGEEMDDTEFDWKPIVDIVDDIANGLDYLHCQGTVHRDLKPKNGT